MLSAGLASRLTNYANQIKQQQSGSSGSSSDTTLDEAACLEVLRAALQPELDRLVQVPFGVPLLHEIG